MKLLNYIPLFSRFFWGLALLALPLRGFAGYDAPVMLIHKYEAEGRRYSLVTIVTRDEDRDPVQAYPNLAMHGDYVESFMNYLDEWIPEFYISIGLIKRGDPVHEALRTKESIKDGRSGIVLLTEENNLGNILAMIRVARTGNLTTNFDKPLELRNPQARLSTGQIQEVLIGDQLVLSEGDGELKNFIQPKDADRNYLGLLLYRALDSGVFEHTFRKVMYNGRMRSVIPRNFRIETWPVMSRHLTKLGFVDMPELTDRKKAFQYYMKIDVSNFYKAAEKQLLPSDIKKPPVPVDSMKIEQVDWEPVPIKYLSVCDKSLGKIPFYREL